MSIPKHSSEINRISLWLRSERGERVALVLIVILVGAISYTLGLSAGKSSRQAPEVGFREIELETMNAAAFQALQQENIEVSSGEEGSAETTSGQVVASKNSDVYHYEWCSGAKRIKEENKVFYNSTAEARAAGLRPAANCKGLE